MSGHEAADIRRQLKHPVVDCDGHWLETPSVLGESLPSVNVHPILERAPGALHIGWHGQPLWAPLWADHVRGCASAGSRGFFVVGRSRRGPSPCIDRGHP